MDKNDVKEENTMPGNRGVVYLGPGRVEVQTH